MPESSADLCAVIYSRVSSDRDGAGRSVGQQETACRTDCDRNGWAVSKVLTDNDRGASRWSRKDRPAYRDLATLLATGTVDVLVTWEASRAQRDLRAYVQLRDLCAEHSVRWSYNGRLYDLSDDDDRFSTGIDALMSEREAGLTRKRVLRDVAARAADGRPHGRHHDGLRTVYDPRTGKPAGWELDPDRAPIVREIAERLLAGDSAYSIAADLNERGITTSSGKPWRGGNIVMRMRSPSLAGLRVYNGKVVEGITAQWPGIVTPAEHGRLLALLSDPRRKSNKEGPGVKWLGTGIYLCGVCDAPMRIISGYRPNGTRRTRYGCSAGHCVQRAAELVDLRVELALVHPEHGYLSRPDILTELADVDDTAQQEAAADAARLRAELADVRRKVDERKLTLDDYVFFRSRWEPQLADAERRARPKWLPDAVAEVAGPDAAARWEAQTMTVRRSIVKALIEVRILPTVRGNQHTPFDPTKVQIRRRGAPGAE